MRCLPGLLRAEELGALSVRLSVCSMLFCGLAAACGAQNLGAPRTALLSTSDTELTFEAGLHAPKVTWIKGAPEIRTNNSAVESLPESVEIGGAAVPLVWQRVPQLDRRDKRNVVFVYESASPHLRLSWIWEARAEFGPVEHSIKIENLSGQEVWLPLVDSLRLDMSYPAGAELRNFYVEKGADTPSKEGAHLEPVSEGYKWTGKSSTYALPAPGEAREIIPAEFVFGADKSQAGWYAGIEFSGRTRISLERVGDNVKTVIGLDPEPGPFRTRLELGGTFETPTVFLGAFTEGADGAGNQLRPWVRAVLGNPLTWKDARYPLTVNNSWGSGMQVDEQQALRMIGDAKELGLEMFHLDAGWFKGVGDWYPDVKKFPHGLAYVADAAHAQGLRFGLWVDWTQAGLNGDAGALNARDAKVRDWLVSDVPADWKPEEYKGRTADLGVPAAREYFAREVKRIVDSYHLDMLEHDGYLVAKGCMRDDHPHAAPNHSTMKVIHDWGSDFVMASNSTDVSYHAVRAYYAIYEQTRREHPGMLFEICNDGGRMVDFGSAAHGDYFSITDTYDPLSNRRAFYDASYVLPAAMLESYVEKWPTPLTENFNYMLRSGMMGWFTVMLDTTAWSADQHGAALRAIQLYKQKLRPLIRDAHLYHVSVRPDGVHWDGMEYWDPARRRGVVYAFRGSIADEDRHRFVLQGLDAAKHYELHFEDGTAADAQAMGKELMDAGVEIHLAHALSSELVFIEEVASGRRGR